MDSDLRLLEISGEDDSLIQQTPTLRNDAVKVTDAFFSISPLQLPISPINQSMKNNVAPKRPGCSSPKISNKENMDFNKAEGPRLTPHQMKRRKKGYNLRKSIAWDKAFFTEEGVLDPDELSLISGTYGNSRGEALSAISEERTKSPYSSSKYTFASENFQALSASNNRNNGGLLMPQHNLLAADSKGVHSNSGSSCNRSGAKSGRCPRPLPSSSLKRPAHVHNTKSAMKVSHLQKFPDHKSGPHSLLKASKSSMLGTSQLKHNQIAHPINTHKNISLESSCKNVKSTQNKEKSGPKCAQLPAKASAQPSRENMANSSLEVNLLTNPPSSQINKPNRSSEANLKPIIPSGTELSGDGLYRPKAVAGLPPRSTSVTVGNESQLQKVKPSGLRMPSPSLAYFAQNNAQPSNIPKCTAIGSQKSVRDFRALHAPKNTSMDIPKNSVTVGLSSSRQCSELAASKAAMHKATKSDLMVNNIKNGSIPLLPDKSSEPKRSKFKVHGDIGTEENIGRHGKHGNTEEIAYELDANVQITNDLKLLESGTCKKSQEDNHGRRVYTQCQNQKIDLKISLCKPENISTSSDLIDGQLVNCHNITNIKKELSTSSYNLEPQNHCLGFEQTFQCTHAICSEESQGKEVNAINELVILERNEVGKSESSGSEVISAISLARSLDGEFDTSLMTEQPPLEAQSGFVEASLPIEIQESSIGPHSRHEVEPIDNTTSSNVCKPFLCEVSGSWVQYDRASLNEGDESEAHSFRNDGIMECVATDFFLDGSGEGKTVDASHIECVDGVVKESSTLRAYTGSEADCSQHVSQIQNFKRTHEDTGGVDLLTSKSRVKLSQLQFREESNLSCSDLVNGQLLNHTEIYNFKSKSSTSSDNLEIQSPCLEVEQNSQCNPALCSEKFQGKEANASTDFVIQENNEVGRSESNGYEVILALSVAGSQSGEFDMNQITEQPDLKSQFGFVEVSLAVEIQDCSIGTHFGHQVEPVDTATSFSGGKHLLGVVSGSGLQYDQASLSEGGERKHSEQENEAKTIVPQLSTSSDLVEGQLRDHSDNFYSESKSYILLDTFELQSPCLGVEQNYQCNPELHSKEFRGKKVNGSKQFVIQERSDSKSEINGSEVIFAPSPARCKDAEFDSNRLTEQPPLKEQFDLVEVSPAVDVQDCSTDIHIRSEVVPIDSATSLDAAKPFLGEMSCSLVPYEQASIHEGGECDAHSLRNNVIMECFAADSCLDDTANGQTVESFQNENTGRMVEETSVLQASCGSEAKCFKHSEFENLEREHDDTNGVDILSSKSEQFKAESSGSSTVSDKCSGDSGHAYNKDSDATSSIRKQSERSTKPNSLIIPPPDVVPFSDEWLAAIEAAGEDILTKKSGAVQNSPPEKSLPEPSPWSPVKRKTNEIGPFDCTKYTNTQPADS